MSTPTFPWCMRCHEPTLLNGASCHWCGCRSTTRLNDHLVLRLHATYTLGATLADLAPQVPDATNERAAMMTLRREFEARRLHIRTASEAAQVRLARGRHNRAGTAAVARAARGAA